jgi:hypothetical protein
MPPQSKGNIHTSGIDWDNIQPKGEELPIAEVLEQVPDGMIGEGGKFKTLQGLANNVLAQSKGELSARMVNGAPHIVRLQQVG